MALATRPKPKVQHKKRRAQHHRKSKNYMKPYWPYLPMLAIVGLGYAAHRSLTGIEAKTPLIANGDHYLTRVELLAGDNASLALVITITIAGIAMAILMGTHWYRVRQIINRGEAYVVHHPWLDIGLVAVITLGFVLTRSTGIVP